jgi:hypothetical protein
MKRPVMMAGLFGMCALAAVVGCSSGVVQPVAAPTSTPFVYPTATTVPLGYAATTADVSAGSLQAVVQVPATLSGSGYLTVAGSSNAPSGFAPPASGTPLGYVTFTVSSAVTFDLYPSFRLTPSQMPSSHQTFFAAFDSNDPSLRLTGWVEPLIGPASESGQTLVLTGGLISSPAAFSPNYRYVFCIYRAST